MSVSTVHRLEDGELLMSPCPGDGSGVVDPTNIRNEIRDDAANNHKKYSIGKISAEESMAANKEIDLEVMSSSDLSITGGHDNQTINNNNDDDDEMVIDTNNIKNGQQIQEQYEITGNYLGVNSDRSINDLLKPVSAARAYIDKLHGLKAEENDHEWVNYADKVQSILSALQDEWKSLDQARKLAAKVKPNSEIRRPGRWPGRPKTIKRDSPIITKTDSDNSSSERTSSRR